MTTFTALLSKELTHDLEWREAELAVMRKQLILSPSGGMQEKVMLRANVAMIYAHYEGFCKFALNLYLDALEKLKLKPKDLTWALATHSLMAFHCDLKNESSRVAFFSKMLGEFNDELEKEAKFERLPQIANLWPDLLVSWLGRLGLVAGSVASSQTLLDSLVDNRNQIAHGKKLVISSREELDKYFHAALLAMHEVAIGIVDSLDSKSYQRTKTEQTTLNHCKN